jgi:hypothetical protein
MSAFFKRRIAIMRVLQVMVATCLLGVSEVSSAGSVTGAEGGGLVGIQHRLFPPRFVMSSELNVDQAGICLICFGAIL